MKKWFCILLGVCLLLVSGCGSSATEKGGSGGTAPKKTLKVGTNPDFAPFEFIDEKGKMVGFDLDLIQGIGQKMNVEIEMQNIAWDGLIPALQSGQIDLAIAGMAITPERQKVLLFSDSYYDTGLTILVPKKSTVQGIKDLEGKKIAVQMGTMSATLAKQIPGGIVREFNTSADAFMELKNGSADAVINHIPVIKYYLRKNAASQEFQIVGAPLTNAADGIAAKLDDKELIGKVNAALQEMKKNGEYDAIYEKWFGEKPPKK